MSKEEKQSLWKQRISEYHASGLSAAKWCSQQNISLSSLRYWIARMNKEQLQNTDIQWISLDNALPPEEPRGSADITIQIGKAFVSLGKGFSDEALLRVLKVLHVYA